MPSLSHCWPASYRCLMRDTAVHVCVVASHMKMTRTTRNGRICEEAAIICGTARHQWISSGNARPICGRDFHRIGPSREAAAPARLMVTLAGRLYQATAPRHPTIPTSIPHRHDKRELTGILVIVTFVCFNEWKKRIRT